MLLFQKEFWKKTWIYLVGTSTSVAVCIFLIVNTLDRIPHELNIHIFQITEGDALLLQMPTGETIAIDGGIDNTAIPKIFSHKPFWDRTIHLLILTHPDSDHLKGAMLILQNFTVEKILLTGIVTKQKGYKDFLVLAEEKNIPLFFATPEQDMIFGDAVIDTIAPPESLLGKTVKSNNNSSVVFRLLYKGQSVLFVGDAEKEAEKSLLERGVCLQSTIVKLGHHGSKTSSTEPFLNAVRPEVALLTSGVKNRFGHPHQETVDRLKKYNIPSWNSLHGDILITLTDGEYCINQNNTRTCKNPKPIECI